MIILIISTNYPNVGQHIYLCYVDSQGIELTVRTVEGEVERMGLDSTALRYRRIYTSIPFRQSYQGAPVMDASGRLIAVGATSDSNGTTVLIPAEYIPHLLEEFQH